MKQDNANVEKFEIFPLLMAFQFKGFQLATEEKDPSLIPRSLSSLQVDHNKLDESTIYSVSVNFIYVVYVHL